MRLPGYGYGQQCAYFVTICTHERRLFFTDDRIRVLAEGRWLAIPDHAPAELDVWVVMPNHMHGILVILDSDAGRGVRQNASVAVEPGVLANAPTAGRTHAKARIAGNRFS